MGATHNHALLQSTCTSLLAIHALHRCCAALLQREPENGTSTFQQRVFICDEFWQPAPNRALGPIFFYLGNEADVTL